MSVKRGMSPTYPLKKAEGVTLMQSNNDEGSKPAQDSGKQQSPSTSLEPSCLTCRFSEGSMAGLWCHQKMRVVVRACKGWEYEPGTLE